MPAARNAPRAGATATRCAIGTCVSTGNSNAAPHVTGLVARLLSKHPHLTPYEVKTVLRAVAGNAVTQGADGEH